MKIRIQLFCALLCCVSALTNSYAQEETKITIPSTPAFSILNSEPTSVMRPNNNKDFGADILNAFDENGRLLMNIGLEVTPYWLKSRPALKEKDYLNPTFKQTFLQSLNLSAATVKDSTTGDNKLGIGLRFKLLNGRPMKTLEAKKEELKVQETIIALIQSVRVMVDIPNTTILNRDSAIAFIIRNLRDERFKLDNETLMAIKDKAKVISEKFTDSPAGIKNFVDALSTDIREENDELVTHVVELIKKRQGLVIEMAGASSFITSASDDVFERAGIWANVSNYVSPTDAWAVTARYMFASRDSSMTNFDLGISYLKEQTTFNISIEGMFRWYRAEIPDINSNNQPITRVEKDFTYRLAVQGSYKLSKDISFNVSIGKDFDSPFISRSGFFSLFGFNYSIFRKEKVKLEN
jgi:hypothetical protein